MEHRRPPGGVSLIVPLQDEEQTVEGLLRSIAAQRLPPDEVVLVDAGSLDATVARAMAASVPTPVRFVAGGRVYPGVARNAGVAAAQCAWIAFTDAGVILDENWLAELASQAGSGVDVVYGDFEPACDTSFRRCAAIAYVPPRDRSGMRGPSVASCLMRREAFYRAGGFPPFRAAEDLIFIERLAESGACARFAPNARIEWQIAGDTASTFSRFLVYSYHNLIAGWGRRWHMGTAKLYAALSLAMVLIVLRGGGRWALLLLPAFFLARALKAAWLKQASFDFPTLTPARILGAAGVLAVIDAATALGVVRWLVARTRN